jgi:hypothetical protein
MLNVRLKQACFSLAACALAVSAYADYGQMRLNGTSLLLAFALSVAYGLIVDVALIARIFRYRAGLGGGVVGALVVIFFLLGQAASPGERAGFFNGAPGGASLVVLLVTSAVFVPFIVIAPFAQYRAMRQGAPLAGLDHRMDGSVTCAPARIPRSRGCGPLLLAARLRGRPGSGQQGRGRRPR